MYEIHIISDVCESKSEKCGARVHKITGVWDMQLRLRPIGFEVKGGILDIAGKRETTRI